MFQIFIVKRMNRSGILSFTMIIISCGASRFTHRSSRFPQCWAMIKSKFNLFSVIIKLHSNSYAQIFVRIFTMYANRDITVADIFGSTRLLHILSNRGHSK